MWGLRLIAPLELLRCSVARLVLRGPSSVDAVNTFAVSAGHSASFGVVSRGQIRRPRSSRRLLRCVRFPAAPLEKGRPEQRFVFPCLADINRPSTSASQVSTTLGSTQRQQSPNGLAVDAMSIDQLSLRISRRREVGVKPETTSVRGSCAARGRPATRSRIDGRPALKMMDNSGYPRLITPFRYSCVSQPISAR
jgi:hypothetical protein